MFVPECELTGRPRSRGHRGEQARIAFLPIRGSSATQLFSKKITNKGMSVQFPRVVRVFPARSLALFNRERGVRYSAGLNAVKDSVRPGDVQLRRCPEFQLARWDRPCSCCPKKRGLELSDNSIENSKEFAGALNESRELQEVSKEVVGIHVLPTRSLFGGGILRRLLRRVSLAKRLLLLCDSDGFAERSLNLRFLSTNSGEEHGAEPVQFGAPRTHFTLLGYCLCLLYCLESFGATICSEQSFSL